MQDKYNHPLTIRGAGKDVTVLDGGGAGSILSINTLSLQKDNSLTINISNLTFRNSGNSSFVVSTTAAPITVSNSAFTGNTTRGAELLSGSGIINLFNNTFSDTVGGSTGAGALIYTDSAVFANDNVFTGNTAHSSDGGGLAVFAAGGFANITNNTFGDNTASGTYGGGLLVFTTSGAMATVSGNNFTNNLSVDKKGGLAVLTSMDMGSVTVSGNTFTGNSGGEGGGLHVATGDNAVFVTNNTFTGNYGSYGGGLFASTLSPSASVTLNGNTFSGNSAAWGSGASVGPYQGFVDISGDTFSDNVGRAEGGALFVAPVFGGNSSATVSDTLFTGNWADKGGAIFVESTGPGTTSFTIQNSVIMDNAAGVSGGGLAASSDGAGSLTQVTLKNNTFTLNRALWGGGSGPPLPTPGPLPWGPQTRSYGETGP